MTDEQLFEVIERKPVGIQGMPGKVTLAIIRHRRKGFFSTCLEGRVDEYGDRFETREALDKWIESQVSKAPQKGFPFYWI